MAAVSVNPIDWKLRSGLLRWISPLRFSTIPCFDFAGTVVARGTSAERFEIGDRVFGLRPLRHSGAAVQKLTANQNEIAAIPANVSFEQAVGVPLAGMTALQAILHPGTRGPGKTILIVGASGGVGHYAVQIAKILQAEVTAVCSTPNVGWIQDLGADTVLDYARGEAGTPRPQFDRVVDAVSLGSFRHWRQWLKPDGIYVTLLPRSELVWHRLMPRGPRHQSAHALMLHPSLADLARLGEWMEQGRLKTTVDSVFPMMDLSSAFAKSRSGHARGKILIRVPD